MARGAPSPDVAVRREAIARSTLEKKGSRAGSARVRELAEAARKKLRDAGPISALKDFQQRRTLDKQKMDARLEDVFSTVDSVTGARSKTPEQQARFNRAEKAAKVARELVEKGYDKIDTADKPAIRTALSDAISIWPEGKAILDGVTDREAFLDEILKDPRMAETVGKVLEKTMSAEALVDKVTKAKAKAEEAKVRLDGKKTEEDRINVQLRDIQKKISDFSGPSRTKPEGGESFKKLKDLRETHSSDKATLVTVEQQLNQLNSRMNSIVSSRRADLSSSLESMQGEVTTLTEQAQNLRLRINQKEELEKEEGRLREQQENLEQQKAAVGSEIAQLTREELLARTDLTLATNERNAGEEAFAKNLEGVMREASMDYLQDRIQEAEEAQDKVIKEEIANAKSKEERDVLEGILNRWDKNKEVWTWRGKKTIKVFDKKQIGEDFSDLIAKGPEEVIKNMLTRGRTEDEAKEIMKNKEFVDEMQDKVVERLITRKLQTGKISKDEARRILESDWGKGMIDAALANKKEIADAFEKLRESGVMHGSVAEFLSTRSSFEIAGMLAAIFGVGLLGAGGAVGSAGLGALALGHGALGAGGMAAGGVMSSMGAGSVVGGGLAAGSENF